MPFHQFSNDGVSRLVTTELPNLIELDLSVATHRELETAPRAEPSIDVEGVGRLVSWPTLTRLRTLDLSGNQIGPDGLSWLLASGKLGNLRELRLRGVCDYRHDKDDGDGDYPDTLSAFSNTPPGLSLQELDLGENHPSLVALRALSESASLGSLKVLRMDYPGRRYERLLEAPWFDSVRVLSAVDGTGLFGTLVSRAPKHLHTATLSNSGQYHYSKNPGYIDSLKGGSLSSMLSLDLTSAGLGDASLKVLAETGAMPNLLALYVEEEDEQRRNDRPAFTPEVASDFARSPFGSRLVSLETGVAWVDRLRRPDPVSLNTAYGGYAGPLSDL